MNTQDDFDDMLDSGDRGDDDLDDDGAGVSSKKSKKVSFSKSKKESKKDPLRKPVKEIDPRKGESEQLNLMYIYGNRNEEEEKFFAKEFAALKKNEEIVRLLNPDLPKTKEQLDMFKNKKVIQIIKEIGRNQKIRIEKENKKREDSPIYDFFREWFPAFFTGEELRKTLATDKRIDPEYTDFNIFEEVFDDNVGMPKKSRLDVLSETVKNLKLQNELLGKEKNELNQNEIALREEKQEEINKSKQELKQREEEFQTQLKEIQKENSNKLKEVKKQLPVLSKEVADKKLQIIAKTINATEPTSSIKNRIESTQDGGDIKQKLFLGMAGLYGLSKATEWWNQTNSRGEGGVNLNLRAPPPPQREKVFPSQPRMKSRFEL